MRQLIYCFTVVALVALQTGCVERRFRVESNPPGALVYINDKQIGPTPIDIPFTYYGTYNITLVKNGYETKHIQQNVRTPWYQYPPIDFISESLWPMQINDNRPLFYEMEPSRTTNLEQLKNDAEEIRNRAKQLPPPKFPDKKQGQPLTVPN